VYQQNPFLRKRAAANFFSEKVTYMLFSIKLVLNIKLNQKVGIFFIKKKELSLLPFYLIKKTELSNCISSSAMKKSY